MSAGARGVHQRTLVKICGISDPRHAVVAVEAGADFVGVVFYPPSIRNVSVEQARRVAEAARAADTRGTVRVVGLFVNESPDDMNAVADEVGLDVIQLSGDEEPELAARVSRPAIGTIRVDSSGRAGEEGQFRRWIEAATPPWAMLIDSHVPGMYGGTGTVADWFLAADFALRYRIVLAGGLAPQNVAAAIRRVRPFAVDVSSGVETDGIKDSDKIRAFIRASLAAEPASSIAEHALSRFGGTT